MKCLVILGLLCATAYAQTSVDQACDSSNPCGSGFTCQGKKCKKALGETCGAANECGVNTVCNADSKCACDTDYYDDKGRCGKKVDQTCTGTIQCALNSECHSTENQCKCNAHFVPENGFCVPYNGADGFIASILLTISALIVSRLF